MWWPRCWVTPRPPRVSSFCFSPWRALHPSEKGGGGSSNGRNNGTAEPELAVSVRVWPCRPDYFLRVQGHPRFLFFFCSNKKKKKKERPRRGCCKAGSADEEENGGATNPNSSLSLLCEGPLLFEKRPKPVTRPAVLLLLLLLLLFASEWPPRKTSRSTLGRKWRGHRTL